MKKYQQLLNVAIYFILIPMLLIFGFFILRDKQYNLISMSIVILMCVPFFIAYEKKESTSRELVLLAIMVSLAVVGRTAFFFLPALNPMAAMVILAGVYLGPDLGFMTGALSPLISNMIFTQGPWTPFQMFSYGLVGFIAGWPFIAKLAKKNRVILSLLGILVGVSYSLLMDIWTVLSMDRSFSIERYLVVITQAIPFTISYLIANVTFLNILNTAIGTRIERVKMKYGINI
ncbi:ECF transporter S component [Vagococcus intermedius]|uniref:ECF transporter S component n=1 Tax=Vagococcus intermedius TaxID=2991418 RepID=A0AAF0CWJ5_9ENTE|nr:ECF transporter S component [Vagococcus intermedius]WEG74183.1 ECF transporter S component [Vagococcus intermedius]WEG76263.1 ECF transporter S component [Vagococcus intermedius]